MAIVKQQDNDEWRSKRSQEQIALGGLPLNAEWRLRQLRDGRLFSSGFSVNELALVTSLGVRPLGQVTGTSVYHVGWLPAPSAESMELRALVAGAQRGASAGACRGCRPKRTHWGRAASSASAWTWAVSGRRGLDRSVRHRNRRRLARPRSSCRSSRFCAACPGRKPAPCTRAAISPPA